MHKTTLFALACLTYSPFAALLAMERPLKRHAPESQALQPKFNTFERQQALNQALLFNATCPYWSAGDIIQSLIAEGANPNTCDQFGNSALHFAADVGNFLAVKALVKGGAQPNVINAHRLSPLHCAVDTQREKTKSVRSVIIKYLILKGADKWITPEYSPLKYAIVHGDKAACISILSTISTQYTSRQLLSLRVRSELLKLKLELSLPDENNVTMQQDAERRGFYGIATLVDAGKTDQFVNRLFGSAI